MKITMKYDQGVRKEEIVVLEIPKQEFDQMIEGDYQYRLKCAKEGEIVERRTVEEIFEELNKQEYNSWQTYSRHQDKFKQLNHEMFEGDLMTALVDDAQMKAHEKQHHYEERCQKIRELLKPKQADMIIAICLDGMRIKDYAENIGATPKQVTDRLSYAKKILREIYSKIRD